jgi:EF hand
LKWIVTNASILFVVALVLGGASSSVGAQSELPATPAQQPAQRNSRVSLEDFTRSVESAATFRRLDKDKNGRISFDEWKKFDSTPDARKHFDSPLSAGEDQITPNGWNYRLPKSGIVVQVFNHMDREHDGSLTEGTIGHPAVVPQLSITW